jgi:hypothetical protein
MFTQVDVLIFLHGIIVGFLKTSIEVRLYPIDIFCLLFYQKSKIHIALVRETLAKDTKTQHSGTRVKRRLYICI